jgi:hypothetical protein
MSVGSISSGGPTGSSAQATKVWTDRKVEQEARTKAVEARREVADDKVAVRADRQAARSQWASKTSSVDLYM